MRNSKNKTGLFNFIADRIAEMDTVDPVIVTKEDLVLSIMKSGWTICLHAATMRRILVCLYMPGMRYRKATKSLWLRQLIQMLS